MRMWGNDYNTMECAGAFGDLGTLIPFVEGYVTINKIYSETWALTRMHRQTSVG